MRLNQRQMKLLKLLFSQQRYWTTEELAGKLNVTSRTIKSDLNLIRDEIRQYQIEIQAIRGKGVSLIVHDQEDYYRLCGDISNLTYNLGGFRSEFQQRAFILYRMIVNKIGYLSVNELAEKLNLSRSVINQEIPEVKKRLAMFHLTLKNIPYHGLLLEGTEIAIRASIIDSFDNKNEDISSDYYLEEYRELNFFDAVAIRNKITELFQQEQLEATSIMIDRITVAYMISKIRSARGRKVEEERLAVLKHSQMIRVIEKLLKRMNDELSSADISFLAVYCLSCVNPPKERFRDYYGEFYEVSLEIYHVLKEEVFPQWKLNPQQPFFEEECLRILLQNCVISEYSLYRMYYTNDIREYCRTSFFLEIACRTCMILEKRFNFLVSRGLLYLFTLFFEYGYNGLKEPEGSFTPIKIVPNFDRISAMLYKDYLTAQKDFPYSKILIADHYDDHDKDSLYLILDNPSLSGRNIVNCSYLFEREKMNRLIRQKYAELNKEAFMNTTDFKKIYLFTLNEAATKKELFWLISGIFNRDPQKQLQTMNFINQRENMVSYENQKNNLAVIPLFEQDETGLCILKLTKPITFKNWSVDFIMVFSIRKKVRLIHFVSQFVRYAMLDPEGLKKMVSDFDREEDLLEEFIKKSALM